MDRWHTQCLGLSSPLSAPAMRCGEEKGFNPSRAVFPLGAISPSHEGGLDHAGLSTSELVEQVCGYHGERGTAGWSPRIPTALPGSILVPGKLPVSERCGCSCPSFARRRCAVAWAWPPAELGDGKGPELVIPREGATTGACGGLLVWLKHPQLGAAAPSPQGDIPGVPGKCLPGAVRAT